MGHEMLVRLAGDRVMARLFHVKHTPIPATAQGRSMSSACCPCRAPPGYDRQHVGRRDPAEHGRAVEVQRHGIIPAQNGGDEPGVVRVPVHRVLEGQRVRLRGGAGGQGAQQRFGEGEQAGDRGEGVAGQADEVLVVLDAGQQHGVAGAHLDAVDEEFGAHAAEDGVDVVDGA